MPLLLLLLYLSPSCLAATPTRRGVGTGKGSAIIVLLRPIVKSSRTAVVQESDRHVSVILGFRTGGIVTRVNVPDANLFIMCLKLVFSEK